MLPVVAFILYLVNVESQEPSANKYKVLNNRILDASNRECFFHGVNVVYKSSPYLPPTTSFDANTSFAKEDMQLLQDLGQNVIRLGVMWPGVNPEPGYFDTTYIKKAESIITTAYSKYNISTLVDCHQDDFSEAVCGEGVPLWATQPKAWNFPSPVHAAYNTSAANGHVPTQEQCLKVFWPKYYLSKAVSSAFQALYSNATLQQAFGDYWAELTKSFKSTPGIVGFELFNEPWAGDIYKDPSLMWPGKADSKNLAPFYDAIVPSIYDNDEDRVVFFESVTWTDEFNARWTQSGFKRVPGGEEYADRSVFSFHFYKPPMGPNGGSEKSYFEGRMKHAIAMNSTGFLTEFDIANDDQTSSQFEKMSMTMDQCDKHLISWSGWEYKPFAGAVGGTCTGCGYGLFLADGSPNHAVRKAVSRTYAQKVAGRTQVMEFDWAMGGNFTLIYEMDTSIFEPTIIYLGNTYWYPRGYILEVDPEDAVIYSVEGDYVEVYNNEEKYNGKNVTVSINPK
eukprot:192504_1